MALPVIDTPRYTTKLVSTGQTVEYRPFLVKEEKILLMALESTDINQIVKAIGDVITSCTFGQVDSKTLPTYDMERLFLKIRSVSVGEIASVTVACVECNAKTPVEINLGDIEIDKSDEPDIMKLTDSISIKMKHPTLMDVYDTASGEKSMADRALMIAAKSIETIFYGDETYDTKDVSLQETIAFVEQLNSEQYLQIQKFIKAVPKVSKAVEFDCMQCGHHNIRNLEGLQSFFT